ncbi:MAG: D-alanine--D-alanine ligase [Candidatus Omnitrophica bacterium]|nr:D-alanine--D-alanine ligase [Candidatus Omnitrophota bacterium]
MRKKDFGKIGVLAGGPSSEREISLKSGKAVYSALIGEGLDAVLIDVFDNIYDIIRNIKIDVAFIALHGRFGEDGTVQKFLEDAGIPYTGSGAAASKLAIDKVASKDVFVRQDIPVPKYMVLSKEDVNIDDVHAFGFPVVVKPQLEGSSIGLSVVRQKEALKNAIDKAFLYGDKIIVEQYIEGRELTVGILSDEPLPVIEIVTKNRVYDYEAKYMDPDTQYIVPANIEKEIYEKAQRLGRLSHVALGCRSFSRVDMMADEKGNVVVLEVNTIPGMTERSLLPKAAEAKGLSFSNLCVKLLEDALSR